MRAQSASKVLESAKRTHSSDVPATRELKSSKAHRKQLNWSPFVWGELLSSPGCRPMASDCVPRLMQILPDTPWTASMEHKLYSQPAAAGGIVNRGAKRSKGGYIFNFLVQTWLISPRFTQYCICIFHQPQNRSLFFLITDQQLFKSAFSASKQTQRQ